MKKSHKFQIEWLSEKTDIKLMERPEKWKFFIELTERRNVCVHNDGRISKIYIENCKKSEIIVQKNLKVGDELSIDTEYLFSVCEYLIFTASKLVHAIWRKQIPADLDASIRNLVNLTVDLIERGYYVSAVEMCDFGLDWRGNLPEQIKLFLILNKAQSLKWLGKIEEMQVILNSIDWNTKSDTLQLSKYVLEEKFEQAALCMKRIGSENTDLNSLAYESFPIFKEFRKSKEFLLSFKEIFGREFELLSKPSVYIGRLDQQDPPYRQ